MKKLFLVLAAALLVLAFSGCSVYETDTESLMRPPLMSEKQEKLNEALSKVAGENYTLKYPATGGTNSAFIFRDLDKDGEEEALAFYSSVDESTRINILKKAEESWVSVYEAAGFSGEIKSIDFAEMDKNGTVLLVKWDDRIGVYRFEKNRLETIYYEACKGASVADIDADGYSDIFVFKETDMSRSIFEVIRNDGTGVSVMENITVHAQFDSIISAKTGSLGNGKNALFLDSAVYEGVYLTEIITLEEERPKRYTLADFVEYEDEEEEEEEESSSGTIIIVGGNLGKRGIFLRNTAVNCMDTNMDGIMEFPVEVREDYAKEKNSNIYYLQYMQVAEETAYPVWNGVANSENGYLFALPIQWNDRVTPSFNSLNNELVFSETETGRVVFKICMVQKNDYQDKYEDYTLAAEDETRNFYAKSFVEPETPFYLEPEQYENFFIFI